MVLAGTLTAGGAITVTPVVALGMPAALAVMVTDPTATPVTGTGIVITFEAKLTVAGTVATPVLLELRLTVKPAGTGADRFSVRFCVAVPVMVRDPCEKLRVGPVGPVPT